MFISQVLFFIIVLSVFSAHNPGAPAYSWPQALAIEALMLAACFALLRLLALRQSRRNASLAKAEGLKFKGQMLSLALLLLFITYFDFKALLYQYNIIHEWEIISAALVSLLFFLHLAVVWLAIAPLQKRVSTTTPSLSAQLMLIVPMVFPWFLLALGRDLLQALWSGGRDFLNSEAGYFTFLALLVLVMLLVLPPLMKKWWRCPPLAEPVHGEIKQMLEECRVRVAEICGWPVLGANALNAAVMGVVPRLRYLLISPKLLSVLNKSQLKAVVAHEAGHIRYKHLWLYVLLFLSYIIVVYCLSEPLSLLLNFAIYLLAQTTWGADLLLNSYVEHSYWSLALALPMLVALLLYLRFVIGFFMRHMERQADFFALDVMQGPAPLAEALEQLALLSGNSRNMPSWHHFSIAERVRALYGAPVGAAARQEGRYIRRAAIILCLAMLLAGGLGWGAQQYGGSESLRQAALQRLQEVRISIMGRYLVALQDWSAGREAEAIDSMRGILKEDPHDPAVLNNLAWFLLQTKDKNNYDPVAALPMARMAAELRPDSAQIWDTLAEAYAANHQYSEALLSAKTALLKVAGNDDINYYRERLRTIETLAEHYKESNSGKR